jgi:hypothetical protein
MIFFNRLFACYYFFCLKLRKINKPINEDFQAMIILLASQFLTLVTIIHFLPKSNLTNRLILSKPLAIGCTLIAIFIGYKYFLSNRNRRNKIIDNYRELSALKKNIWQVTAAGLILIPLIAIAFFF